MCNIYIYIYIKYFFGNTIRSLQGIGSVATVCGSHWLGSWEDQPKDGTVRQGQILEVNKKKA